MEDNLQDLTLQDLEIRKLSARECWRLQGFSDEDYEKAAKVNSRTQLIKQAGNSICVPVLEAVFKKLFKEYINEKSNKNGLNADS